MKPKPILHHAKWEMFRLILDQLVDSGNPQIKLGQQID